MKLDLSISGWSLRWKQVGAGVAGIRDAVFCFEGRFSARLVVRSDVYLSGSLSGFLSSRGSYSHFISKTPIHGGFRCYQHYLQALWP